MTRLPAGIAPVDLGVAPDADTPEYEWRGACRWPGCDSPATDPHHIVRRSAGGRRWVYYQGWLVPNIVGLCRYHHDQVTVDKLGLAWNPEAKTWTTALGLSLRPLYQAGQSKKRSECCPSCGRKWPKPKPFAPTVRRRRRSVPIRVPADEGEDGTEVLPELADAVAELIYGEATPNVRYHAIIAGLAVVLHNPDLVKELVDG